MVNREKNSIIKILLLVVTAMSFFETRVLSFNIAGAQVALYHVMLIILLLYTIATEIKNKKSSQFFTGDKLNMFSIIFNLFMLIWSLFSVIWAKDLGSWAESVVYIATFVFLIYMFGSVLKTKKDIYTALTAVCVIVLFHCIIGWYELITRDYLFIDDPAVLKTYKNTFTPRAVSCVGENEFAGIVYLGFFASIACYMNERQNGSHLKRIFSIFVALNCLALIIISNSRATLLGFLLALAFFFFTTKVGKCTIPIVLAIAVCMLPVIIDFFVQEFELTIDMTKTTSSNTVRFNLIRNGFHFFGDTFGFGIGSGQMKYWLNNFAVYDVNTPYMHNLWVELLSGYGFIVFIGFIVFYGKMILDMYHAYKYNQDFLALMFCCYLIGNVIVCISTGSEFEREWKWAFYALIIAYQGMLPVTRPKTFVPNKLKNIVDKNKVAV